eukprot:48828-Eustigmatos_ZCMA.PRE.1
MLAWKARVGYSLFKIFIHRRTAHAGMRSHLFTTKMRCLWDAFFLRCFSRNGQRVPGTLRASRT